MPWCFVRPSSEVDLFRETLAIAAKERDAARAAGTPDFVQVSIPESLASDVLAVDRRCPEWFWYTPGLSPAEHRAERNVLRLEEQRKAHAQQLADMQTRVQKDSLKIAEALKDIAQQTKEIHEANQATSGKTDTFVRDWTKVAVIVGVAAFIVVVATYLYPEAGRQIAGLLSAGWERAWDLFTRPR